MYLRSMLLIVVLVNLIAACQIAEIRTFEEDAIAKEGFRADQYVDNKWESEIIPFYTENAVELAPLLAEINDDPDLMFEYGNQESQGSEWNFMVRSEAVILVFGNDRLFPEIEVDLPPYDGEPNAILALGPPIRTSMGFPLRDASGTISFNEFINQEEHGAVANELLNRSQSAIADAFGVDDPRQIKDELQAVDFEGRTVVFYGAMALTAGQDISAENWADVQIVPVIIEVQDG